MPTNSENGILLSPSIIASDLSMMGQNVATYDPLAFDLLHLDVMDGNFVPNLTFGPDILKASRHTLPFRSIFI